MRLFFLLLLFSLRIYGQDILVHKNIKEVPINESKKVQTKKVGNYSGPSTNFFYLENGSQIITLIETLDTNLFLRTLNINALVEDNILDDSLIVELYNVDVKKNELQDVVVRFKGTIRDFSIKNNRLQFQLYKSLIKIPYGGYFVSIYYTSKSNLALSLAFNKKNDKEVTFLKRNKSSEWESVDYNVDKPYNLKAWFEAYANY